MCYELLAGTESPRPHPLRSPIPIPILGGGYDVMAKVVVAVELGVPVFPVFHEEVMEAMVGGGRPNLICVLLEKYSRLEAR